MGKAGNNYSSQKQPSALVAALFLHLKIQTLAPRQKRGFSNFFEENLKCCHPGCVAPSKWGHHLLKAALHDRGQGSIRAYSWPDRRMCQAGLSLESREDRKKNAVRSWCVWRADNSDRRQFLEMVSIYQIPFLQCLSYLCGQAQGVQYCCEEWEGDCWSRKLTTCCPALARHREQVQMHTFLQCM